MCKSVLYNSRPLTLIRFEIRERVVTVGHKKPLNWKKCLNWSQYQSSNIAINVCFISFIFHWHRNHHSRSMEQRNNAITSDCRIVSGSFSQRYLDDTKCDNDWKYNYPNGPKEVPKHTVQILCCPSIGKTVNLEYIFCVCFSYKMFEFGIEVNVLVCLDFSGK